MPKKGHHSTNFWLVSNFLMVKGGSHHQICGGLKCLQRQRCNRSQLMQVASRYHGSSHVKKFCQLGSAWSTRNLCKWIWLGIQSILVVPTRWPQAPTGQDCSSQKVECTVFIQHICLNLCVHTYAESVLHGVFVEDRFHKKSTVASTMHNVVKPIRTPFSWDVVFNSIVSAKKWINLGNDSPHGFCLKVVYQKFNGSSSCSPFYICSLEIILKKNVISVICELHYIKRSLFIMLDHLLTVVTPFLHPVFTISAALRMLSILHRWFTVSSPLKCSSGDLRPISGPFFSNHIWTLFKLSAPTVQCNLQLWCTSMQISPYDGFLKWGYPQIMNCL